jgi:hypothetical protein
MHRRIAPYIFLAVLALIVIFFGGFRAGQFVEHENKAIDARLALTPHLSPTAIMVQPTDVPLGFKTYLHKECGVQFTYPTTLKKTKESSTSAQFEEDEFVKLAVSCDKKDPFGQMVKEDSSSTESSKINPLTGRKIYFFNSKELQTLVDTSVKFK